MKPTSFKNRRAANSDYDRTNRDMAEIFKSLADRKRVEILRILLREGKLNVSKICEELGESQPAVSHHLTQLKHARLVDFERDGKFNYYFISSETIRTLIEQFFPNAARSQQTVAFGDLEFTFKIR